MSIQDILAKVKTGGDPLPPRIYLHGVEGIGKTTFGAGAPDPLFICPEDGLIEFPNIPRITGDFGDVTEIVKTLVAAEKCPYKTVVVDTVDWLERQIHEKVMSEAGVDSIEQIGYGKGYKRASQFLVRLLRDLDILRSKHKVRIIFLGHVHVKTFTDPAGDQYDRWESKGNKEFAGIVREWVDCVLFANRDVVKIKRKDGTGEKASAGERMIHTTWHPGFDAKNRLSLPETLPLDWNAYAKAEQSSNPAGLVQRAKQIWEKVKPGLDAETAKKWESQMSKIESLPVERIRAAVSKLQEMAEAA